MNVFMIIISLLYIGAGILELYRNNMRLAIVYTAWAVSNAAMSIIGRP
jgi:hypothetical protein